MEQVRKHSQGGLSGRIMVPQRGDPGAFIPTSISQEIQPARCMGALLTSVSWAGTTAVKKRKTPIKPISYRVWL